MGSDWLIAIPSFDRLDALRTKTLPLLCASVPATSIHVFADPSQVLQYKTLEKEWGIAVHRGGTGVCQQRCEIMKFKQFKDKRVVEIDDDIEALLTTDSGDAGKAGKLIEIPKENFRKIVDEAWRVADAEQAALWGVYTTANALFMSHTITKGTLKCTAQLTGYRNKYYRGKPLQLQCSVMEDFERCLLLAKMGEHVLRFNHLAVKSQNRAKGGCSSRFNDYHRPRGKQEVWHLRALKEKQEADNLYSNFSQFLQTVKDPKGKQRRFRGIEGEVLAFDRGPSIQTKRDLSSHCKFPTRLAQLCLIEHGPSWSASADSSAAEEEADEETGNTAGMEDLEYLILFKSSIKDLRNKCLELGLTIKTSRHELIADILKHDREELRRQLHQKDTEAEQLKKQLQQERERAEEVARKQREQKQELERELHLSREAAEQKERLVHAVQKEGKRQLSETEQLKKQLQQERERTEEIARQQREQKQELERKLHLSREAAEQKERLVHAAQKEGERQLSETEQLRKQLQQERERTEEIARKQRVQKQELEHQLRMSQEAVEQQQRRVREVQQEGERQLRNKESDQETAEAMRMGEISKLHTLLRKQNDAQQKLREQQAAVLAAKQEQETERNKLETALASAQQQREADECVRRQQEQQNKQLLADLQAANRKLEELEAEQAAQKQRENQLKLEDERRRDAEEQQQRKAEELQRRLSALTRDVSDEDDEEESRSLGVNQRLLSILGHGASLRERVSRSRTRSRSQSRSRSRTRSRSQNGSPSQTRSRSRNTSHSQNMSRSQIRSRSRTRSPRLMRQDSRERNESVVRREAAESSHRLPMQEPRQLGRDRQCPSEGCTYAVTWHRTHCCQACSKHPCTHGWRCDRRPVASLLGEIRPQHSSEQRDLRQTGQLPSSSPRSAHSALMASSAPAAKARPVRISHQPAAKARPASAAVRHSPLELPGDCGSMFYVDMDRELRLCIYLSVKSSLSSMAHEALEQCGQLSFASVTTSEDADTTLEAALTAACRGWGDMGFYAQASFEGVAAIGLASNKALRLQAMKLALAVALARERQTPARMGDEFDMLCQQAARALPR
eukprot:TRINITY_DN4098_c0_g1_i1.p1 TRINITY_DN4098_c0_g1~~TRINITY_DN4098_c0_g1_i1.p1  ORF type:complete len:1082 (-),score=234.44 TRINITY_DN4098_c0_g1_i1:78-3323(-)